MEKEFYTAKELAEKIGVSDMTIYNMVKSGEISAHRFRGALRFAASDVEEMIERSRVGRTKEEAETSADEV